MDNIDIIILKELLNDSSISHQKIGDKIFLSSQAVSQRVKKLKENGLLQKYSIEIAADKLIYIEVYLNKNEFFEFEQNLLSFKNIISLKKMEGSFCYLIKYFYLDNPDYQKLLQTIEHYGRYKINRVSRVIK